MDNTSTLLSYTLFNEHKRIFAFTTTVSTLGIKNVRFSNHPENQIALAKKLNIGMEQLVFPSQTHTNCVATIDQKPEAPIEKTDALISNTPGICICVQTADCVPILLYDSRKQVISAIHAGWRGTVGKIVQKAVSDMKKNYHCNPEDILAAIGPSISPEIYEVGDEVVEAAKENIPNANRCLHQNKTGKYHFNLWEANKQLLLDSGLLENKIEVANECSFLEKKKYYSARRDGIETGRMVSGIMLKL